MTIDEYWAAVRRLGLRPHTGNVFVTSTGDFYRVPDPTKYTSEDRVEIIEKLKVRMGIAPPSGLFN
jgi:hypothetical protein